MADQDFAAEAPAAPTGDAPNVPDADPLREKRGFGRGRGGGGRGAGRGGPRRRREDETTEWVPVTKLGRLVKAGKIESLEHVYIHSLALKEAEIVDHFLPELEDEVMKIMPVQKQTTAGQRTRFKAFIAVGDKNGHIGLGVKTSAEVANAIKGAITLAKLTVVPVRRGYWGSKVGMPHTVCNKLQGKCGSVRVRLIPAPRGTGLVAAPATKKMLFLAGIKDCYTSSRGHTRTMGNFIKAIFAALKKSYSYLAPDLWEVNEFLNSPYADHSDFLARAGKPTVAKA
mmetsp:Transcript_7748/g.19717  ORF Transcript_7748/g.19717 Transcript_7748/m.19717 type:complete len:284 (+) Transcript_7748:78-929(+)|eukprot:CAMPEP_0197613224 /NCGR_PEP_ID=MMETSP1326-20131121/58772_1 /TAXON_ID=1155430 /ORGANISM="Genus nov. species nov., Strain RCC2288" /LENGTH=283 /DNA_ID=CAMNT_0043182073 /DNA_START=58 /DNA_END=909 /DNA_ORIENTATION=+